MTAEITCRCGWRTEEQRNDCTPAAFLKALEVVADRHEEQNSIRRAYRHETAVAVKEG